jgi:hypothetical protein
LKRGIRKSDRVEREREKEKEKEREIREREQIRERRERKERRERRERREREKEKREERPACQLILPHLKKEKHDSLSLSLVSFDFDFDFERDFSGKHCLRPPLPYRFPSFSTLVLTTISLSRTVSLLFSLSLLALSLLSLSLLFSLSLCHNSRRTGLIFFSKSEQKIFSCS